jgi:uncharacterized protein
MENRGYRKFVLTGSSARKLRRGASNLLAGRALLRRMYPLNTAETDFTVPPAQALRYGMMPLSVTAPSDELREEYLTSYVTTYLNEEIKFEGLVRDAGSFARFLEVACLSAAQRANLSNLARATRGWAGTRCGATSRSSRTRYSAPGSRPTGRAPR